MQSTNNSIDTKTPITKHIAPRQLTVVAILSLLVFLPACDNTILPGEADSTNTLAEAEVDMKPATPSETTIPILDSDVATATENDVFPEAKSAVEKIDDQTVADITTSQPDSDSNGVNDAPVETPVADPDSTDDAPVIINNPTPNAGHQWDVTVKPPVLNNPRRIVLPRDIELSPYPADSTCAGQVYHIRLDKDEDVLIEQESDGPLSYPVRVVGGHNLHIRGLDIKLITQPGCEVGKITAPSGKKNANIHPGMPGAMAVRLEQWGHSYVEGALIDVNGHGADCFVVRNPNELSQEQARKQRDVTIQNTLCMGVEGQSDGVHGDFLQTQGDDVLRNFVFENITHKTSFAGFVLSDRGAYNSAVSFTLRRYFHTHDTRFYSNDDLDKKELYSPGSIDADTYVFQDFYIERPPISPKDPDPDTPFVLSEYIYVNGERYGPPASEVTQESGLIAPLEGLFPGTPPGGDFAPTDHVGRNYISPH